MAFTDPRPGRDAVSFVAGVGSGCLFFILLFFPVLIGIAMGDAECEPRPACTGEIGGELLRRALMALGPALLLGAALRSLIRWLGQRLARDPEAPAGPASTPWWAFAAIPLALVGGTWLVWGVPFWRL